MSDLLFEVVPPEVTHAVVKQLDIKALVSAQFTSKVWYQSVWKHVQHLCFNEHDLGHHISAKMMHSVLGRCGALRAVDVTGVQDFSDAVLGDLQHVAHEIEHLRFNGRMTELTAEFSEHLDTLFPSLRSLELNCRVAKPLHLVKAIARLPHLQHLALSLPELATLGQLAGRTELRSIRLECSNSSQYGPLLNSLENLERIELTGRQIPSEWIEAMPPKLTHLKLRCSPLGVREIAAKYGATLKHLDLTSSTFGNDQHLGLLALFNNLDTVVLTSTDITSLDALARSESVLKVQHLDLQSCKSLTNAGLKSLEKFKNLKRLYLSSMPESITPAIVPIIASLKKLEKLDLYHFAALDDSARLLTRLPMLDSLNLQGCKRVPQGILQALYSGIGFPRLRNFFSELDYKMSSCDVGFVPAGVDPGQLLALVIRPGEGPH